MTKGGLRLRETLDECLVNLNLIKIKMSIDSKENQSKLLQFQPQSQLLSAKKLHKIMIIIFKCNQN